MRRINFHHRVWRILIAIAFFIASPAKAKTVDPHDGPSEEAHRYVGTPLQAEAEHVIKEVQDQGKSIAKAIELNIITYTSGEVFACTDESKYTYEDLLKAGLPGGCSEGLAVFNNRIDYLRAAAQILEKLNNLRNILDEDQQVFKEQKQELEKAAKELQELDRQKNLSEDLKKPTTNSPKVNDANAVKSVSTQSPKSSSETSQNNKFLDLKKKIEDELSLYGKSTGNLTLESSAVLMGSESHFLDSIPDPLINPQSSKFKKGELKFRDWAQDISKFKSLRDQLGSVTGLSEQESQTKQKLETALAAEIETLEKSIAQSRKVADISMPTPTSPISKPPQKQTPNEIKNLEAQLEELNKLETEINNDLNSNAGFQGINLEQQYKYNLGQIKAQKKNLEKQISEVRNVGEGNTAHNSEPVTNLPTLPPPEISTTEFQPSNPPPISLNNSPQTSLSGNNSANSQFPRTQENRTIQKPSGNSTSPKSSIGANVLYDGEEKPTIRVSSLEEPSQINHDGQKGNRFDSTDNLDANRTKTSISNQGSKITRGAQAKFDSKDKRRKISSIDSNNGSSDESNQYSSQTENSRIGSMTKTANFGASTINGIQRSFSNSIIPEGSGSLSTGKLEKSDKVESNDSLNETRKNQAGDFKTGEFSSQEQNGFSLRKMTKREARGGARRKNEDSPTNVTSSLSKDFPNNTYQPDNKVFVNKRPEDFYIKNADGTFSKDPKANGNLTAPNSGRVSATDDLTKLSADIKSDADFNYEIEQKVDSEPTFFEKAGFQPALDSMGKILEELYPLGQTQKPSEITKLLKATKGAFSAFFKDKRETASEKLAKVGQVSGVEAETKPQTSLVNRVLAWFGFN